MADDLLSPAELQQLKEIATQLPTGHPAQAKVNLLLNSQPTPFEQNQANNRGFLGTAADKASSAWDSLVHPTPMTQADTRAMLKRGPGGENGFAEMKRQATRPLPADLPTEEALAPGLPKVGHAMYRAATTLSPLVPFLNPEASEADSAKGDTGAVAAEAVIPAVASLAPSAINSARGALKASRVASAPSRGLNLLERTTSPGGMKAEGQLESRLTNQRAAPYLAAQERETPVVNKQPATIGSEPNPLAKQDMGVMNYRQNAQAAGQKLWTQIEPRARMYDRAPFEGDVSSAIRATVNPTEAQLNPGKVAGVESLAKFYEKPTTVGEAMDRITELNNDKGVQAYEKALPDKQAELLKGDPTIEGKITAANKLRDGVFDSIAKHGSSEDANWIRSARQDWGALSEVSKNLGNTQVPTPAPLMTRVMNSSRLVLSPSFARESISKPVSTLFDLNNPNRLALKSSRTLGASTLSPAEPPPIRVTPWDPEARPTGPVVGPTGQGGPMNGGSAGPMITPEQTPVPPIGPGNNVALFPDIPSGQAPSAAHAAGEVPNWPPKVLDWGPSQPPHDTAPATYPSSPTHPDRFAPPTQPPVPSPSGAPAPPAPSATPSPGGPVAAPPTQPAIPGYKPSEKAATLSAAPRDLGPEFHAGQRTEMITRYKDILRNPRATSADITEANARLQELGAVQ